MGGERSVIYVAWAAGDYRLSTTFAVELADTGPIFFFSITVISPPWFIVFHDSSHVLRSGGFDEHFQDIVEKAQYTNHFPLCRHFRPRRASVGEGNEGSRVSSFIDGSHGHMRKMDITQSDPQQKPREPCSLLYAILERRRRQKLHDAPRKKVSVHTRALHTTRQRALAT